MAKLSTAKITNFETSFDAVPVASADGEVIWADVRIEYILGGLTPCVTIRVPVPYVERDSAEERKAKALRCARQLIDHACRASGVAAAEPDAADEEMGEVPDAATPTMLEGIAQELGLAPSEEIQRLQGEILAVNSVDVPQLRRLRESGPVGGPAPFWAANVAS